MMMNKRLIGTVRESKKYVVGNVISQWISLAVNIGMMALLQKCSKACIWERLEAGRLR